MIRFTDMRGANIPGCRFAFWNTATDSFVSLVVQAWDTWAEFEEEFAEEAGTTFSNSYPLGRLKGLCPPWVFVPPPLAERLWPVVGPEAEERLGKPMADRWRELLVQSPQAEARLAELAEEANKAFLGRPVLTRDREPGDPPHYVTLGEITAWYAERGVAVKLSMRGHQMFYDHVGLYESGKR